jgi:hypothetical protein
MRRVALVALLALALPVVAAASSITIVNSGGKLTGSTNGLSLSNSTLIQYGNVVGTNLGTLSFTTGALTSGSLKMGGTFAAGGTFVIVGNGTNGIPNGTIFSGTFSSPVQWLLITNSNNTHSYELIGDLSGKGGSAATVQLTFNTGKGYFNGKHGVKVSSGDTNLVTPEPETLGLFGTGLLGVAGLIRRRIMRA